MEAGTRHAHQYMDADAAADLDEQMDRTISGDFDLAKRTFDELDGSGFAWVAIARLADGALCVEAYAAPMQAPVPSWFGKSQLDRLGSIADDRGLDLHVTCWAGRMTARFT